jgi:hypothetical protein
MLTFILGLQFAQAEDAILRAEIHTNSSTLHVPQTNDSSTHVRWPFCSSYTLGQSQCSEQKWIELDISLDSYIQRRNNPHSSLSEIMTQSVEDLKPIAAALRRYFLKEGIQNKAEQVGHIQGLIQSIHYAYDSCGIGDEGCVVEDTTGWVEYPKFAIEFFVDQKGDCDDAMISSVSLLEGLGFEGWIVEWEGHVSTAISRSDSDIAKVHPPPGSHYIHRPDVIGSEPLLHMDSVGTLSGCTSGCAPLGWNEWPNGYNNTPPLHVLQVLRYNDIDLDQKLPLRAFLDDTVMFSNIERRDRRADRREKILAELEKRKEQWEEESVSRLEDLGVEEEFAKEKVREINPYIQDDELGWALISSICFLLLAMMIYGRVIAKKSARSKAKKLKKERENEAF